MKPWRIVALEPRQRDVGGDGNIHHQSFNPPFARNVANSRRDSLRGGSQARLLSVDKQGAGGLRQEAEQGPREFLAAGANDACDA